MESDIEFSTAALTENFARAGGWKIFVQMGTFTKTKLQPVTSAPRHRLFASPCSTSVPCTPQSERKRNRFSTPFPFLWSKEHLRELSFECDCQAYNYYYLFFFPIPSVSSPKSFFDFHKMFAG
ncbi:hypothetical protein NPIL_197631 [Nephila pilipes]|uniref:Uncharacterized protein n=1 Tax=Nephila pilipes TaxID=299642 RepID=A0A8X6UF69_NEPPI|nr:hypothetical protein NPIL_197631 [Nephila pilipes]